MNFYFPFSQSNKLTQNAEGKVFVKQRNINKCAFYFSNRVVTLWNAIPVGIKFANHINKIKNFLDEDHKFKIIFKEID